MSLKIFKCKKLIIFSFKQTSEAINDYIVFCAELLLIPLHKHFKDKTETNQTKDKYFSIIILLQ